jgi:hypothetical protein
MQNASQRQLRCYLNWLVLDGMDTPAAGWMSAIKSAGYDGIQLIEPADPDLLREARANGLGVCGSGRVNHPGDAYRLAEEARKAELECLTLHVGWGYEDEDQGARLIEAVLDASARNSVPMYVETHRATLFQDLWRTVQFTRRFPQLQFNGDFSHWYTGLEMVYGGFENKLSFIQPVIERVYFLHGRIGNPGCMQVDIGDLENASTLPFVAHFRTLWTQVFVAFLRRSSARKSICFAAELLASDIYYARKFCGSEESDRWQQSLVLVQIARECFDEALQLADGRACH